MLNAEEMLEYFYNTITKYMYNMCVFILKNHHVIDSYNIIFILYTHVMYALSGCNITKVLQNFSNNLGLELLRIRSNL